jgi:hypothetical protein
MQRSRVRRAKRPAAAPRPGAEGTPANGKMTRAEKRAANKAAWAAVRRVPKLDNNGERKRPVDYTPELGQQICDLVAEGNDVATICRMPGMPTDRAVRKWAREHEEFGVALEAAREHRANVLFDSLSELTEDIRSGKVPHNQGRATFDVLRFRIQQDGRRRYGERPAQLDVKVGVGIQAVDTTEWIKGILASANPTNAIPLLPPKKPEPLE